MELYSHGFTLRPISKTRVSRAHHLQSKFPSNIILRINRCLNHVGGVRLSVSRLRATAKTPTKLEQPGGKMVAELVGAFNELTERMNVLSTSSSRLLFKSLKLSIPILQALPFTPDGRSPLSKALSVALVLAELQDQGSSV